jgi:arylsulfatase K
MPRPNIVFIQSDSMDGRVMGCAGHPAAHTPNMDAIAARGTLFQNAYCNSPQCVPSRASMWSGKHVHSAESWNNDVGLEPGTPTFKEALEKGGYRTAIIGRTDHWSGKHSMQCRLATWTRSANITKSAKKPPRHNLREDVEGERVREQDWPRVDKAVQWLKEEAKADESPFFLHLGFNQPHPGGGYNTNVHYLNKIDPAKVTLPARDDSCHPVMEYMRATKNCLERLDTEAILAMRRHYFAMIAEVDAMIGHVLGTLEELGLSENTYVIYTSDHGDMGLEHGQYLKNALYEPSARVPLVIAGPGLKPGAVWVDPVSLVDIYPTLMDMSQTPKPAELEGTTILPIMQGKPSGHPARAISEYHSNMQNTGSFMLRQGDWKLILYVGYEPQLFNLKDDPDELVNCSETHPDILAAMGARLRQTTDYEATDAKAKDLDRASFREWREDVGEEEYRTLMAKFFNGWAEDDFARVDAWANA